MNSYSLFCISMISYKNMNLFEQEDYKVYLDAWMSKLPKKGRGMGARMAQMLNVHTTMISHILGGQSDFSVEQALKICEELLGLNALETQYFLLLVQRSRAANTQSRKFFTTQIQELRQRALNLSERMPIKRVLEPKDQAVFYSDWYYSGIRLLTALPGGHTVESIAQQVNLPNSLVKRVLEFLVETGLVQENQGTFSIGEAQTYVGADSMFLNRHHINWRLKLLEEIHQSQPIDLRFTNTVTLSKADFMLIREKLVQMITEFRAQTAPSKAESLACLTLDWILIA